MGKRFKKKKKKTLRKNNEQYNFFFSLAKHVPFNNNKT
jgi:hypothetical protein